MKGDAMTSVPTPDAAITRNGYARIQGERGGSVVVHKFNSGGFRVEVSGTGYGTADVTADQLAQLAELLRRIAAGEPIKP